jgi:hypothetical protein
MSVEELYHFYPPMGIGSAYTSRPANGDFAWTILLYLQITQPGSSIVTHLSTTSAEAAVYCYINGYIVIKLMWHNINLLINSQRSRCQNL